MNHRWLFRMKRWVQRPAAESRVKFVLAIILICVLLVGLEQMFGVPEWMQMAPRGIRWSP
ncbi:MAG: hypothetical protein AAGA28_09170 [Pseudomonadota bacterium]